MHIHKRDKNLLNNKKFVELLIFYILIVWEGIISILLIEFNKFYLKNRKNWLNVWKIKFFVTMWEEIPDNEWNKKVVGIKGLNINIALGHCHAHLLRCRLREFSTWASGITVKIASFSWHSFQIVATDTFRQEIMNRPFPKRNIYFGYKAMFYAKFSRHFQPWFYATNSQ